MRIQRMDGSDDGQAGEYIIGENGVITPRKFNPWNADIHYGLTVNPAERGLVMFWYLKTFHCLKAMQCKKK